jgi:hypothetical protein
VFNSLVVMVLGGGKKYLFSEKSKKIITSASVFHSQSQTNPSHTVAGGGGFSIGI